MRDAIGNHPGLLGGTWTLGLALGPAALPTTKGPTALQHVKRKGMDARDSCWGLELAQTSDFRLQTCRHSRYDTTHTHTKKTTTKHISPHSSWLRRTACRPHRRPLVRVSNHFDEPNQLSHLIQPPPQNSLQSSSRLRQGSAGLALSRSDLLPDHPPPPNTNPITPARRLTNTAPIAQLPRATVLLLSLSVSRALPARPCSHPDCDLLRTESAQRASRSLVIDPVAARSHCSNWPVTAALTLVLAHDTFISPPNSNDPPWPTPRDPLRRNEAERPRPRRYPWTALVARLASMGEAGPLPAREGRRHLGRRHSRSRNHNGTRGYRRPRPRWPSPCPA